ncbi:MAG: TonB-dependent receptor [Bacteroidales bacterium]|nr:TonB-dependent receptor [Bacteroidales bacterium]
MSQLILAEDDNLSKKPVISGHITDKSNGEELIGATIFIKELNKGAISNLYGFYSLSLEPGNYTIAFSYLGYKTQEKTIVLKNNITINIELEIKGETLEEVLIVGKRKNENITKTEMSSVKMQMQTIKKIPAFVGEIDVIKAIQLLPGVQSTSEGSSGFSVRGGSPDQNLIILDEATVYNASHTLGFFSVFNNDAIKDVKLYKGDIPASYGGRLSSLLDVRMKNGNSKKTAGTGGIGSISSRFTIEGPIEKNKTSYIVSGRRTYMDIFLPFAKDKDLRDIKLYFYDLNLKINKRINENNRLFLSGYFGRDVFKSKFFGMGFGNQTITLRWNHLFSKQLFSNLTLIRSKYNYNFDSPTGEANPLVWQSSLCDYCIKMDYTYYLNPDNTVKFGFISTFHTFKPGSTKNNNSFFSLVLPDNYALQHGIYVTNNQNINRHITLKYGLRFSAFQNIGKGTIYNFDNEYNAIDSTVYKKGDIFNTYSGFEPRIGFNFMLNEHSSIKGSYSRTIQYIHLAQNSTSGTPLDLWFPSSPNVKPQYADQVAIGYFRNFRQNTIETSVEVYYKKINDIIDFKEHAAILGNRKLEGELRFGTAKSYGAEFLIKIPQGKLNGWISYTYSHTERDIPEINNGKVYLAPYDKPHDIAIVLNYQLSNRVSLSANWIYATGAPVTFPTGGMEIFDVYAPVFSDRNSYRMPDYHRLDFSLTLNSKVKPNKAWEGEWVLSIYNVYARKNAWAINFVTDKENPNHRYAEMTYLFSIVPAITYNFRF